MSDDVSTARSNLKLNAPLTGLNAPPPTGDGDHDLAAPGAALGNPNSNATTVAASTSSVRYLAVDPHRPADFQVEPPAQR